jgi:hypothetical protein
MRTKVFVYVGAFLVFAWGVSHFFPTKSMVEGFGNISQENRNIFTMEWIVEGVTLVFIGLLAAAVTVVDGGGPVSRVVYWVCFAELNVLSAVSLFTGFKVDFLPFKLCPAIFTGASIMIVLGTVRRSSSRSI